MMAKIPAATPAKTMLKNTIAVIARIAPNPGRRFLGAALAGYHAAFCGGAPTPRAPEGRAGALPHPTHLP